MKRKFRIIGVIVTLAMVVLFAFGGTALAADPPDVVSVTWDGAGSVGATVTAGNDATAGFATSGGLISGSYTATDFNNNPYSYNVDTFNAYLIANVTNGSIVTSCTRTDSYVPMYGISGQSSYSYVRVVDGFASMAYQTTTNYAAMKDGTYGYQLPGGHNIIADADYYELLRYVVAGDGDSASVLAFGNGQAILDCMSSEAYASSVNLGRGCGCYTDANFNATGTSGYFNVTGTGGSSIAFPGLGISSGGGSLSVIANWLNSFGIADYSVSAQ